MLGQYSGIGSGPGRGDQTTTLGASAGGGVFGVASETRTLGIIVGGGRLGRADDQTMTAGGSIGGFAGLADPTSKMGGAIGGSTGARQRGGETGTLLAEEQAMGSIGGFGGGGAVASDVYAAP